MGNFNIQVNGRTEKIDDVNNYFSEGGEATIYKLGNILFKIYKPPNHPDFTEPWRQKAVKDRIDEYQSKLPAFPRNLPSNVVSPTDLILNNKMVIGYTMQLLSDHVLLSRWFNKKFRGSKDINDILNIFLGFANTMQEIHSQKVVVGDVSEFNLMVSNADLTPYFIDADSMQYDSWPCRVFSVDYVDPLNCDLDANEIKFSNRHSVQSDWYGYLCLLFTGLTFEGPYGGKFTPPSKMTRDETWVYRRRNRITVFDEKQVGFPKNAMPFGYINDDLLQIFYNCFVQDRREPIPKRLLESLRFTTCSTCGSVHMRNSCPSCGGAGGVVTQTIQIMGNVKSEIVLSSPMERTKRILFAQLQNNKMLLVRLEDRIILRENGEVISTEYLPKSSKSRIRVCGKLTVFAENSQFSVIKNGEVCYKGQLDVVDNIPMIDANSNAYFWLENGNVYKNGDGISSKKICSALQRRTKIWVGENFGFGWFRVGAFYSAFTFPVEGQGKSIINDFPRITGQLIDMNVCFSKDYAWIFISHKDGPKLKNKCLVVNSAGDILAFSDDEEKNKELMKSMGSKSAISRYLFVATDEGLKRFEVDRGEFALTREFPDTSKFISDGDVVWVSSDGTVFSFAGKSLRRLTFSV